MFDIGFWELLVIALLALCLVGPERLPELAKNIGGMIRKFQNLMQSAKREVEKELKLDELHDLEESIQQVDNLMDKAPDKLMQTTKDRDK